MTSNKNFEIERKFIVRNLDWKSATVPKRDIKQVYVCASDGWLTRLRIYDHAEAEITIKGPQKNKELGCPEFNVPMPIADAFELWNQSGNRWLEKERSCLKAEGEVEGLLWEVDEFKGIFNGLIVAEIELPSADTKIVIPDWIACEVTGNPAFNNHRMAKFVAEDDGIFNYVDYFYENVIDTLARK